MNQIAGALGQFVGTLIDPVNLAVIALCAYVARYDEGRWYHAALVIAVVSLFSISAISSYQSAAGLSGSGGWVVMVVLSKIIVGSLAFYAVRAFRNKRRNVLR